MRQAPPPSARNNARAERRDYVLPAFVVFIALLVIAGCLVLGIREVAGRSVGVGSLEAALHAAPMPYPVDPTAFSAGSCMAYEPTSGEMRHQTVFLDAGHGGIDPGGVGVTQSGQAVDEATETLAVELDAMSLLRRDGYRVVVSRTSNTTVLRLSPQDMSGDVLSVLGAQDDVASRDVCANDAKASVLVGIYFDAGYSASDAGGLTAFDSDRSFSSENLRLANLLQFDVMNAMNSQGWSIPNDGVQPDTQLGSVSGNPAAGGLAAQAAAYDHLLLLGPSEAGFFTTPSEMPGAIIEPLYITDPFEASLANNPQDQMVIATGIAQAVEQFLQTGPKSERV